MKRILYICLIVICFTGNLHSQTAEKLSRNVLASFDANEMVKPGEFQMELQKAAFFNADSDTPWFSFVYTTVNKYTGNSNVMVSGHPKIINKEVALRTYKIGPTHNSSIFVIKNIGANNNSMGHGMEQVMANGVIHPNCDSVMSLNDDGYVYMLNGQCFYSHYKSSFDNQLQAIPVVWLEKKVYHQDLKVDNPSKAEALSRLSDGDVYFESSEGHFYYLYRDIYMPYTVLVLDDKVIELFDVYNEDNLRLKFSYNGKHWMAVGNDCFWVDGVIKSNEGYTINDFIITDHGHYVYKASENDNEKKGEVVIYDGHVIRRDADVCYFGLNGEGKLKLRFVSGDRFLQYENEKITDVTSSLVSVYYPEENKGRSMQVLSSDGSHKLTYRYGVPSVEVDGVKVADSEPCYAVFDQRNNVFVWNAIETQDMKTELVIYRYAVPRRLFDKLFK